ncbi:insulin gene enhancer protein isl-1 [Bactrocera neohumeralis]|uniref:insulin gene enhancer protein isl-1 n=1 Tax=Bactrocera tryoni TaxID=59916 RepID=UPI001A97A47A|nr:insulin gene enhancer protein isl-1 [Bactrocera tryoni]XP_050319665.1 insulin gene enhancer protein isl-1 [Bactrocera neohumeralis]
MVMAEIGGHLAHQLPNLHNHTQSGLQPSLVMNHHLELDCHGHDVIKKQRLSLCVGCGGQIHDQYILRVAPDLEWHAACLKCQECRQFLDESCTCFVRDGKTYCKRDYVRLFGTKCDKCGNSFSKNDFVMRAKTKIFHIECFRCSACARQLLPGDEFALRDGGILYCKEDHDVLEKSSQSSLTSSSIESNNNNSSSNNNNTSLSNNNHSSELGSMSDSGSESGSHKSIREKRPSGPSDGKPTRVRTVLNEKQLHTLRTCYNANPRPDALMKEQLVEMTGLSPRVIRVWFQNKRCKDKKKTIQMKLQMQQEKEGRKLGYGAMQGIPMIASSPVRHDSPLNLQGIDVQTYQPPWKALSDFALHADLDSNGAINTHTPAFQQLVNQMHGYDLNGMPPLPPHQQQGPHPPPPGQQMNGPPIGSMDSGITSHHHPDSTDSYVTYLESDDKSKLALTPTSSMSLSMSSSSSLSSASTSAATSIASPPSASNTAGALLGSAAAAGAIGGLGVGGVVAAACALNPGLALGGMAVGGGGGGGVVGSLGVGNTASCGQAQSATEQLMQMLQKVTASPTHAVL